MLLDMLQLSRPPQDSDPTQFEDPLVRNAYAVGRVLEEVDSEPGLGKNERLVALAMCLYATRTNGLHDLSQIMAMTQLSKSAAIKAVGKLAMTGFVRAIREPSQVLFDVQFPHDCEMS